MPRWKAYIQEVNGNGEPWHVEVTAEDDSEALRAALEIFLNTEDHNGISFDYRTLAIEELEDNRTA